MDTPDSLPALVADFNSWRKQKSKTSNSVPDGLHQRAVLLLKHHKTGPVTSALRITTRQLTQ